MPMLFLAPIFFAGLALLGIPFLIHQIRRPEREPLRFSSLMFVPKIDKQVIERRRLQHILLMLLRMLLLIILIIAFARPILRAPSAMVEGSSQSRHLILLDVSYSMGILDTFDRAKQEALELLDLLGDDQHVGVMVFADSSAVLAPFSTRDNPGAGGVDRAREAMGRAELSQGATAYLPALQSAQEILLDGVEAEDEMSDRYIIHLISDFQAIGMPPQGSTWKLSPRIRLQTIEIEVAEADNVAISDLSVRKNEEGALRVLGKVKNWSDTREHDIQVQLVIENQASETDQLKLGPGSASQASFVLDRATGAAEGWLQINDDELDLDNRRYFVWNPPVKKQLLLIADHQSDRPRPGVLFLTHALQSGKDLPWVLTSTTQEDLPTDLDTMVAAPDLILAGDLNGLNPTTGLRLLDYASEGGKVLFFANDTMTPEALNAGILEALEIEAAGLRYLSARETQYDLMDWVNFTHPIFATFDTAVFNDFSALRFRNYHRLILQDMAKDALGARAIALFEAPDDGNPSPAIVDVAHGKGRLLIWSFGSDLRWSNLPKNVKFVPLLQESVGYLLGGDERRGAWEVGHRYDRLPRPTNTQGRWVVQMPGEEPVEVDAEQMSAMHDPVLKHSGFFRWRPVEQDSWQETAAVNPPARESDPRRIDVGEFSLKLASNPLGDDQRVASDDPGQELLPEGYVIRREFWRPLFGLLFVFLLLEGWYASRLLR